MASKHRISFWEETSILAPVDVLIVGGGIVGMNTAITLKTKHPDLSVLIIDRGTAPIGASTRNAGFACFGSLTEVVSDIETMGYDAALDLIRLRQKGLRRLLELTGKDHIDYKQYGGFEVFLERDVDTYAKSMGWLDKINADLQDDFGGDYVVPFETSRMPTHLHFAKAVSLPFEGQLHPGKMVEKLQAVCHSLGVRCLFGLEVESIHDEANGAIVRTVLGVLRARHLVVATNGFALEFFPELAVKPARNQVLVSEPIENFGLRGCFHYNEGYVYFRNVGDRLLIGGARNIDMENESTSSFGMTDMITSWLSDFASTHILGREVTFTHSWSGILGVGPSKQPIIQTAGNHITTAVRLGGMGVAIGSLVGHQAAEQVLESL